MLCYCSKGDQENSGLGAYEKRHNNEEEKQQKRHFMY
jgi:hypothetical protein